MIQLDDARRMLDEMEFGPTGDLVRENGTLQVFWSPIQWTHPPSALLYSREDWVNLGTEGWWASQKHKEIFYEIRQWADDLWPEWPGDWSRLDDIGWTWEI